MLSSPINSVDTFEGRIELVYESVYDTFYFTYYVKNENVRIDKFDNNHSLIQTQIINLENKQVFVLSPAKKLYTRLEISPQQESNDENFIILKTNNSKMINNVECYQWRVKNTERNTEISYWVSQNNYYFFEELLKLLGQTDKTFEFFEKIPETQGFFPMLAVERTLLRKEKARISVLNIESKTMKESIFKIPSDFEIVKR